MVHFGLLKGNTQIKNKIYIYIKSLNFWKPWIITMLLNQFLGLCYFKYFTISLF